ncbi:hypothetical protein G6F55_012392 [Rhizopus delemar]|nr:hypothetical protein G6F55_012392 [Rhizopus delemar]
MNANVYQHILDTTLRDTMQYYNFNWSNIYFQHDNDPKHKAKSTIDWLDNHQVRYISDWPAQSPDLNPIEHVWHQLNLKLSCYERRAKNTDELWERVEKVWNGFDKELCQRYIDSMPKIYYVGTEAVCAIVTGCALQKPRKMDSLQQFCDLLYVIPTICWYVSEFTIHHAYLQRPGGVGVKHRLVLPCST